MNTERKIGNWTGGCKAVGSEVGGQGPPEEEVLVG